MDDGEEGEKAELGGGSAKKKRRKTTEFEDIYFLHGDLKFIFFENNIFIKAEQYIKRGGRNFGKKPNREQGFCQGPNFAPPLLPPPP